MPLFIFSGGIMRDYNGNYFLVAYADCGQIHHCSMLQVTP